MPGMDSRPWHGAQERACIHVSRLRCFLPRRCSISAADRAEPIAVDFVRGGTAVTGIDSSPEMIALFRANLA